jgi:hypothetical protein
VCNSQETDAFAFAACVRHGASLFLLVKTVNSLPPGSFIDKSVLGRHGQGLTDLSADCLLQRMLDLDDDMNWRTEPAL